MTGSSLVSDVAADWPELLAVADPGANPAVVPSPSILFSRTPPHLTKNFAWTDELLTICNMYQAKMYVNE